MFKKSCLAISLMVSAALASSDKDWNGRFVLEDGRIVCRTAKGITLFDAMGIPDGPKFVYPLEPSKGGQFVKLNRNLTPHALKKVLEEQVGPLAIILPPALSEYLQLQAPDTQSANPITEIERKNLKEWEESMEKMRGSTETSIQPSPIVSNVEAVVVMEEYYVSMGEYTYTGDVESLNELCRANHGVQ